MEYISIAFVFLKGHARESRIFSLSKFCDPSHSRFEDIVKLKLLMNIDLVYLVVLSTKLHNFKKLQMN